jgi:uncharacterized protein (DUF885 family)
MLFWRTHPAPQAVDFLVNEVGHERENAAGKVPRSVGSDEYGPLYQCAYQLGTLQFRALHAELVDSGKMTSREFHDAVMRLNSIPVEMIRATLREEKLSRDYRA